MRRRRLIALLCLGVIAALAVACPAFAPPALAQTIDLENLLPKGEGTISGRMVQVLALLTVLSLAPGLLIMVTSFTRFIVVLSFLRAGLGMQTTPANLILISLALFMTFFVMEPVFTKAWNTGVRPLVENRISEEEAAKRIIAPFRTFMLANVRDKDLEMFETLAKDAKAESAQNKETGENDTGTAGAESPSPSPAQAVDDEAVELRSLIPAFMVSELRRGFEIGFLIALPFLVIDLIVATLTMSMGMMMLPPTVISLPFKILFFVLVDGWALLVGGLINSYAL